MACLGVKMTYLDTSLVEGARSVPDPLASFEEVRDVRVMLVTLELLEGAEVGVLVI